MKPFIKPNSVKALGLSIRTQNALINAEIFTLQNLLNCSKNDLKKVRHFGAKSIAEVEEMLAAKGLELQKEPNKYWQKLPAHDLDYFHLQIKNILIDMENTIKRHNT
jgi:DNA-directed RNA polymerase alpha subunit